MIEITDSACMKASRRDDVMKKEEKKKSRDSEREGSNGHNQLMK